MRVFLANVKKDIRLFIGSPANLAALFLPVVLLVLFLCGRDAVVARRVMEPFTVAVRDQDETIMSRTLFYEMSHVELIEQIVYAEDSQSDEELFQMGCAAVVTLPKDFFYVIYDMQNAPVDLVLNTNMPVESEIVREMVSSVARVAATNQAAALAVWEYKNGDLPPDAQFYEDTAKQIITDALTMGSLLNGQNDATQIMREKVQFFLAAVCSMLCMLLPLSVLRTLPEEGELGILGRFRSLHASLLGFLMSKLVAVLCLGAFPCVILLLITGEGVGKTAVMTLVAGLLAGFGGSFLLTVVVADGRLVQLLGNLFLMCMLVVGGGLYPYERIPASLQRISRYGLPYLLRRGMGCETVLQCMQEIWPLFTFAALSFVTALILWRKRRSYL